jgi:hypothetical protein
MPGQHYSFMFSRPGLKPGHRVPLRLRLVDTLTVLSSIPLVIAICIIPFSWVDRLGLDIVWKNQWAFYGYMVLVLLVSSWAIYLPYIGLLRLLFHCLGMVTQEESQHFHLKASKDRIGPWPECWQGRKNDTTSGTLSGEREDCQ